MLLWNIAPIYPSSFRGITKRIMVLVQVSTIILRSLVHKIYHLDLMTETVEAPLIDPKILAEEDSR
jgi:hypothetical protein